MKRSQEATNEAKDEIHRDYRREIERYLDKGVGACHLRRPEIAEFVSGALQHFNRNRYILSEWVIMPNHVHAIVLPIGGHLLGDILKSWKQFRSRRAKAILNLGTEPFWQRESYDHWIRDDDEKARIERYIRNNPVRAGLCSNPQDWKWGNAYVPK